VTLNENYERARQIVDLIKWANSKTDAVEILALELSSHFHAGQEAAKGER
jgi:hypothetical protein